jgi:RNA polymerase sigma-70 factor (ECF subfamily)
MTSAETPRAWDQFAAYRPQLVRFLLRYVSDPHLAEDLAQETLLRGYQFRQRLRENTAMGGWLRQIAYHIAMDWHRRTPARLPVYSSQARDEPRRVQPPPDYERECRGNGVRWSQRLRSALAVLSPKNRALVIAHYFVGLSCREIALRGGLSLANVKVRLHRARQELRRELPPEADFRAWLRQRGRYEPISPVPGPRPRRRIGVRRSGDESERRSRSGG